MLSWLSIHPLLSLAKKRPFENESKGRNRERWEVMVRPTWMTFYFPSLNLLS